MLAWNGRVYFSAFQTPNPRLPAGGWSIWATNATPEGTLQVSNLSVLPGATAAEQRLVATTPEALWFLTNPDTGARLWRTSGTAQTTTLINTNTLSNFQPPAPIGSRLVFLNGSIVMSAGNTSTEAATLYSNPRATPTYSAFSRLDTPAGPLLVFASNAFNPAGTETRTEIVATNGTPAGTRIIRELVFLGTNSVAFITRFVTLDGKAYFTSGDATRGTDVFVTDGTPEGTVMHTHVAPGSGSSPLTGVVGTAGGKVYAGSPTGQLLAGTALPGTFIPIADLGFSASGFPLVDLNGKALFGARYSLQQPALDLGTEPYVSDGTPENTTILDDILTNLGKSSLGDTTTIAILGTPPNARAVFAASPNISSSKNLYRTDGISDNFEQVAGTSLFPTPTTVWPDGDRAFFVANTSASQSQLWAVGPTGAPWQVSTISAYGGPHPSRPIPLQSPNGRCLLFAATDDMNGREPWITNITYTGAYRLLDIAGGSQPTIVSAITPLERGVLFGASQTADQRRTIYRWGGSRSGPMYLAGSDENGYPIRSISNALSAPHGAYIVARLEYGDISSLCYTNGSDLGVRGLTASTGNLRDVVRLTQASEQSTGIAGVVLGENIVFEGYTISLGVEPCIANDGSSQAGILRDIFPGSGSSTPRGFTRFNGRVLFFADAPGSGREPWVTNGTDVGTIPLADLLPGTGSSEIPGTVNPGRPAFVEFGQRAYFVASTSPALPSSLFSTDGTPAGTRSEPLGSTILSGADPALAANASSLFFFGSSPSLGDELYAIDSVGAGPRLVREIFPGTTQAVGPLQTLNASFIVFSGPFDAGSGVRPWFSGGSAGNTSPFTFTIENETPTSVIPGPTFEQRTFFVAMLPSSRAALCSFTTDPNAPCVIGVYPAGSPTTTPPWGLTLVGSRLFLAPPDPTYGTEPTVIEVCPADFNNDGTRAPEDFFEFLSGYFARGSAADLNGDSLFTPADVFLFLKNYIAGGC